MKDIIDLEQKILTNKLKYEMLLEEKSKIENELKQLEKERETIDKARLFLLELGELQRKETKEKIESIATEALQYILQEEIYFEIEQEEKREKISTEFYIRTIKDGIEARTLIEDVRGDGIFDVVTLVLNIAILILLKKENTFIVLDEPCKQLSRGYIQRVGEFLKDISQTYNIQIIMITHIQELTEFADKKFKVEIVNGVSQVNEL